MADVDVDEDEIPSEHISSSDAEEAAEALEMPDASDLTVEFFNNRTRKRVKLVANTDPDVSLRAKSGWIGYEFTDILYIVSITIEAEGYGSHNEVRLSYTPAFTGDAQERVAKFLNGKFSFSVNAFIAGFGINPDSRLGGAYLTSIRVSGTEPKDFNRVIQQASAVEKAREDVRLECERYIEAADEAAERNRTLRDTNATLGSTIAERTNEVESLKGDVSNLEKQVTEAEARIEVLRETERSRRGVLDSVVESIDQRTGERKQLADEIAERKRELRDLEENINLFPSEIAGYVKQGTSNAKIYAWLCVIPFGVIVFITVRLFLNADDITNFYDTETDRDIVEFLISRAPYVLISGGVLLICYTILSRLIAEIVNINRRKQELFKIGIIATDISFASETGLDLSDQQRYDLRTYTKMELLKEHLRQHMGKEYSYRPRSSLLDRLAKRFGPQVETEDEEPRRSEQVMEDTEEGMEPKTTA